LRFPLQKKKEKKNKKGTKESDNEAWKLTQSYPARALDRKLQVDWTRDARENLRILMSLRADFGPMF